MSTPAVAYRIPLDGATLQGVATADRPLCAMVTAFAAHQAGADTRGEWKEKDHLCLSVAFTEYFMGQDVPWARAGLWSRGVRAERMGGDIDAHWGKLIASQYQLDTIRHLTPAGGLIGMAPGLGKTLTAGIAARHATRSYAHPSRCWILAPLNAFGTWEAQREELLKTFAEVRIISHDSLHKVQAAENVGGVLIADEIHRFRRMEAERTKLLHKLRRLFDVSMGLTGTVLHGGVEGVLSMLDACIPGSALFASRWAAGEYFKCIVKKDIGGRTVSALEKPSGPQRERFLEYLSSYATMLASRSESVRLAVEIPEQHVEVVRLGEPWDSLSDAAADLALQLLAENGELPNAQQVAHALCRAGIDEKLEWVESAWTDHNEPLVLFANYTETLDRTEDWLKEQGATYVRVDGGVTGAARAECVKQFQAGQVAVFLGQIGAAGIAVDLFRGHISVALDHSWKGDEYAQALARTARRGQQHECFHFDLVMNQLQQRVVDRLQAAEDFNSEAVEWCELRRVTAAIKDSVDTSH